jgi:HPt (histidine-containing phosphotransfer) domain-containing protein
MTLGDASVHLKADERRAIGAAISSAACHDPTVRTMLLAQLMDANTTDLADLRRAVVRRDWPGVNRTLHRIKGSAALARCPTLVAAGKSLESAAGNGNAAVVNTLLPRYAAILKEFNDTLSALRPGRSHRSSEHDPGVSDSTNLK